jgi:hypothetical protein
MRCEKCGCCEAYVYKPGTPDELQWTMCLWCADNVACPNLVKKRKQAAAQKAAAAVEPPHHDHGVMHFAGPSKVSRAYRVPAHTERARSIPTTSENGDVMPKNNIEDLRNDLFETLRSLKGEVKPIEIERAKAIVAVAGRIIDTGKLEVAVMRKVDQEPRTEFFGKSASPALNPPPGTPERPQLTNGKDKGAHA